MTESKAVPQGRHQREALTDEEGVMATEIAVDFTYPTVEEIYTLFSKIITSVVQRQPLDVDQSIFKQLRRK